VVLEEEVVDEEDDEETAEDCCAETEDEGLFFFKDVFFGEDLVCFLLLSVEVGGGVDGKDKILEEEVGDLIFLCFFKGENSSMIIVPGSLEGLVLSKTLTD
jgi:hypothetical protein